MEFRMNKATYWYELDGNGPVVMLLHGFTGSTKTWSPFIDNWKQTFQLLTVDLPGHGRTTMETGRTMEACCHELKKLCNHLGITDVCLVGYSMGGRTALSFTMLYPEMVSSLILESASPGLEAESERQARMSRDEQLAEKIEAEGVPAFVDYWENIPLFQTQKVLSIKKQQTIREERLDQTEQGLAQSLRYMGTGAQPSWWEELFRLTVPALLIAGGHDKKFIAIQEKMAKCLPNAEFVIAEHAGHAIHVEQPAFFNKVVTEFFNNHCSTT